MPGEGGYLYIMWFSFVLGLIFIFVCSKFIFAYINMRPKNKGKSKLNQG